MAYVSIDRHVVRSYELDSYGHVNNAVYLQWLEHGRSRLLQDFGYSYNNIEEKWGVRFVLVSSKIDFKVGLRLEDQIKLTTTVTRLGRTSVGFRQEVLRMNPDGTDTLAAGAETAIVFTDPKMRGPLPIPEEFRRLYGSSANEV